MIDKGIPTAGLLAQVLVAKFLDHQPLYRQEGIFARAGHSTLGRSKWLFAGSLRGGQRAAAAMSLIQSAKLNGHDRYLKDVLARLPTQPHRRAAADG